MPIKSFKEYLAECNGNNRKAWAKMREDLRDGAAKNDRRELFAAVMKRMSWFLNQTGSIDDCQGLYAEIASQKVNNYRSKFYLYG